jgi:hypothetical protein
MSVHSFKNVDVVRASGTSQAVANASSMPDLKALLPVGTRAAIGQFLEGVHRTALKASHVNNTLATLQRHSREGTFPQQIIGSVRDPKTQTSKEFLSSAAGATHLNNLEAVVSTARQSMLDAHIAMRKAELEVLQSLLAIEVLQRELLSKLDHTKEAFASTVGVEASALPTALGNDFAVVKNMAKDLVHKTLAIAHLETQREIVQKMKKLSLKSQTDVEMTGVGATTSVEKLIDTKLDGLRKQIAALGNIPSVAPKRVRTRLLTGLSKIEEGPSQVHPYQACEGFEENEIQTSTEKGKRKREEERQADINPLRYLKRCKTAKFNVGNAESYPNCYTSVSDNVRLDFHYHESPWVVLDSLLDVDMGVFKQDGIVLPRTVEAVLCHNYKYILHKPLDTSLLFQAWQALTRTVRIKWMFRNTEDREFNPRFHVAKSTWNPEPAAPHIEHGLEDGKDALFAEIARLQPSTTHMSNPDMRHAQSFLQSRKLLVKLTDKNLGLAVLSKEWYHHECIKHLGNRKVYKPIPVKDAAELKDKFMNDLDDLELPFMYDHFIREKTTAILPKFHVIPKVHKNPWSSRPIVPSHSWVTSRLSEVVDDILRPVMSSVPWVVNSTKDVIDNVEAKTIWAEDNIWLVTGDVEAFYTNVPIEASAKVISEMYRATDTPKPVAPEDIEAMLHVVMTNNLMEYDGVVYHQKEGLAMGTSCAPLVANLYAAWLERHNGIGRRIVSKGRLLLYNRYIDDILFVFKGSYEELMHVLKKDMLLPGFNISWNYSRSRAVFLDIEFIMNTSMGEVRLHSRLYRKPMNKFMYIPWSSAHPETVKKSFVKAELTRFRTICSLERYFMDARRQFYENLRRRGYPSNILENWFSKVSYSDRHKSKTLRSSKPLLLPSSYNDVWKYVSVREVRSAMMRQWTKGEIPDTLNQPLLKSLHRTDSIFDLISVWNKTVLKDSDP